MNTIEIYKDRNDNYYVQAGDYKIRIADGTRHDGTTISHFELVKKLPIHNVVGRSEQLVDFLLHLNSKELINNQDFDYEKEAKKYLKKNN